MHKKITIIASFRNEEENISPFYKLINKAFKNNKKISFEIMFVDDCSNDNSKSEIIKLSKKYNNIKYFTSKINYGGSPSIKFAINNIPQGNYACVIDCDMQDDPSLIVRGLKKTLDGEVTNFVRKKRDESFFQLLYTNLAYKILNFISKNKIIKNSNHFKILSPLVIKKIKKNQLAFPYWNYFMSSLATKNNFIYYNRKKRRFGLSKFNFFSKNPWFTFLSGLGNFIKRTSFFLFMVLLILIATVFINYNYFNYRLIYYIILFMIITKIIFFVILIFFNRFIKNNTFKKLNIKFKKIL